MPAPVSVPDPGDRSASAWLSGLSLPVPKVGEERLARLAGEGNERAFGVLYERYHQTLYRYCRSLLHDDNDAQDALQSTFAAALAALRRGQRDAPLRPWLFRIAHNESITLLRRRRPEEALSDTIESPALSVERSAEERARLASLVADLAELPERQRGALLMRELSGLSHEDIAAALSVSVGAAKQTIFEARRSLTEFAEGRAMACEEIQRVISDGDGRGLRARRVRAHLRDCAGCATFAAAIPAREADLLALSPVLPIAAAAGLLARVTGAGSGHSGSAGGLVASATGKAATTALSLKVATAGVLVVAAAGAGAAGALHATLRSHGPLPPRQGAHIVHHSASGTAGQSAASGGAVVRRNALTGAAARRGATATTGNRVPGQTVKRTSGPALTTSTQGIHGNSGSAPGLGVISGAANGHPRFGARAGSSTHPSATRHPGAANHPGAARHPGAANHPSSAGPSAHPGSSNRSGSASHSGATGGHPGLPSNTGQPVTPAPSSGRPSPSTADGGSGRSATTGSVGPDPVGNPTNHSQPSTPGSTATTPTVTHRSTN